MLSRVVPATSVTIARSLSKSLFRRLDFPTLGFPTIKTLMPDLMILPVLAVFKIFAMSSDKILSLTRTFDFVIYSIVSSG